jgi:hypothetical protein
MRAHRNDHLFNNLPDVLKIGSETKKTHSCEWVGNSETQT